LGYGFLRFSLPLFPTASVYFTPLIFVLSGIAIVYASLTTLRQIDLKRIIAYSSVSHMGLVTLAIFTRSVLGIEASIFLMIAHGITSGALFICVTILYDKFHTRIIKYYRGIGVTMPLFAIIFSIFSLANLGLPLTANFVGEFLVLLSAYQVNPLIAGLATTGVIYSAAYSLFLYNRVTFGAVSPYIQESANNRDIGRREFYVLLPLVILVFFLGIYPDLILNPLHASVLNLVAAY
jgi:proton-translocating NADH-quinone oxidoreductase chain M